MSSRDRKERFSSSGHARHGGNPIDGRGGRGPVRILDDGAGALRPASGVLLVHPDGWGELRKPESDYAFRKGDILVEPETIRSLELLQGSLLRGRASPARTADGNDCGVLREVEEIDGLPPDSPRLRERIPFKQLTSIDPVERFRIGAGTKDPSLRVLDMLTPLGKGQRGLIVAPPRTGKTMLLQKLAHAISENHPEAHLIVLLVDERPEEATDWKRSVRGEVLSSTSDEMAASHVAIAELVIERAKRLVELGRDVVILFDSLTRLGRAYNLETRNSGRTLSGGVDARTLEKPKAFFGAARKAEEGGSLTMIATALIETGSRMDEVIFEEFKGTGNMELVLSRKLADLRIFPAVDPHRSGTRKEEKLLGAEELQAVWSIRRALQENDAASGMRWLIGKIEKSAGNEDLWRELTEKNGGR
jgi:transcription termination factor Rho